MEMIKNVTLEKIVNVVEPPVRNHLKCVELEVICGRWVATRVKLQGTFYEEKCGHIYFLKRIYCMQFLGFNMGKSTLFPKLSSHTLRCFYIYTVNTQIRPLYQGGCLEEVKTNAKF